MSSEVQRPASNDEEEAWKAYWKAQEMPWRTEPEIDEERKQYLAERRTVQPDIESSIYPFKGILLDHADIEWLLATHEDETGEVGPINWDTEQQLRGSKHSRNVGLDLRGARLQTLDLRGLPLARTQLELADLRGSHLERTDLRGAYLGGANLRLAYFDTDTLLDEVSLSNHTQGSAALADLHWGGTNLSVVEWESLNVLGDEIEAHRPGTLYGSLIHVTISPRGDTASLFHDVVKLAVQFGINIASSYASAGMGEDVGLGLTSEDLSQTRAPRAVDSFMKALRSLQGVASVSVDLTSGYKSSVRAYRQVSTELRDQGMSDVADHFAYRAQLLQRQVLRLQGHWGRAFGSWLLDLISGYGYEPIRSVITYLIVILSFAAAYFALTNFAITPFLPSHSSPLAWYEAIVLSISSFHGRGFFPTGLGLGDPIAVVAAFEAIIGLLIEITFIATFTQRFFAR